MVASVGQQAIQLILSKFLGHKEKSFVESCLSVDPLNRQSGLLLLKKTLFSTSDSTVHANTLKVTTESMSSRFQEIKELVQKYDRCIPELMSEELTWKFSDLHDCLSSQLDRVSELTRDEIQALRDAANPPPR